MKVDKLFHVLVVAGAASTVGLTATACGDDEGDEGGETGGAGPGTGGASASGGSSSSGGTSSDTGGSSGGDMCDDICEPNADNEAWIDCGGCCCWLEAGATSPLGPICGEEPCCVGRGR